MNGKSLQNSTGRLLEELPRLELAQELFEHFQALEGVELEAKARKERFVAALDGKLKEPRLGHLEAAFVHRKVAEHRAHLF